MPQGALSGFSHGKLNAAASEICNDKTIHATIYGSHRCSFGLDSLASEQKRGRNVGAGGVAQIAGL
jgi:hypothetical protein